MIKNGKIKKLLNMPPFAFEKFHRETKIKKFERSKNIRFWPEEWKTIYYKGYGRFEEIVLPKPKLNKTFLKSSLVKRESARKFSDKPLSLVKLSTLLYYSAGIKKKNKDSESRFYPSAGGRFPLEVYLISLNTDLTRGSYHYYVKNNSLEKLFDFKKKTLKIITDQKWVKNAGCLVIVTAIFKRNTVKYGERGYRHILVEAGHMAQNFYLISNALGLSICSVGGYMDDKVNNLIDLDGVSESVIYVIALGEK